MESGQLIKQRKDRIVYNSSIGQTKPANKLVRSTNENVQQKRLGSTVIKDGKVIILPGCC
jgi:hypothetical protein